MYDTETGAKVSRPLVPLVTSPSSLVRCTSITSSALLSAAVIGLAGEPPKIALSSPPVEADALPATGVDVARFSRGLTFRGLAPRGGEAAIAKTALVVREEIRGNVHSASFAFEWGDGLGAEIRSNVHRASLASEWTGAIVWIRGNVRVSSRL